MSWNTLGGAAQGFGSPYLAQAQASNLGNQALAQQARNYHTTVSSYMLISDNGPVSIYDCHVQDPKLVFLNKTAEGIPDSVIEGAFLLGQTLDQLQWLSQLANSQAIEPCLCYVLASEQHVMMARMAGCYQDKEEVLQRIKFRG